MLLLGRRLRFAMETPITAGSASTSWNPVARCLPWLKMLVRTLFFQVFMILFCECGLNSVVLDSMPWDLFAAAAYLQGAGTQ